MGVHWLPLPPAALTLHPLYGGLDRHRRYDIRP